MDLSRREELAQFLHRHGIEARKGLGQHFLCSSSAVRSIVDQVPEGGGVLEVGPGPGVLTSPLSHRGPVIALDLDPRMKTLLAESAPSAEVIISDALSTPLLPLLERLPKPRAIVSNMPYNITGPLLARFVDARAHWDVAVLMMQKEVGRKILAPAGDSDRGALSVRVQALFQVRRVCDVPAGAFLPPPKVDSIVLCLKPLAAELPDTWFKLVGQGFAQPRKTLANNLAAGGYDRAAVERAGLRPDIRPHQLTQDEWLRLAESLR